MTARHTNKNIKMQRFLRKFYYDNNINSHTEFSFLFKDQLKANGNISSWHRGYSLPGKKWEEEFCKVTNSTRADWDDKIGGETIQEEIIVGEPKLISSFVMEKYSGESAARIELKSNDDDFMAFVQRVHEKTKGLIETKFVHAQSSDFETKSFDLGTKETGIPKPGPEVYPKKAR